MSTTPPPEPQPALPALKPQLVWSFATSILAAVLWTLAAVGAIDGQERGQPMPLVTLGIGVAASASVIAAKLWLDYHRRLRERAIFVAFVEATEARHRELMAAVRDAAQMREAHHQMLVERIDAIPVPPTAVAAVHDLTQRIADGPNGGHRARLPYVDN